MLLRSIYDWITSNPKLDALEELNTSEEYFKERPEMNSQDNCQAEDLSTSTSGAETSILNYYVEPQPSIDSSNCINEQAYYNDSFLSDIEKHLVEVEDLRKEHPYDSKNDCIAIGDSVVNEKSNMEESEFHYSKSKNNSDSSIDGCQLLPSFVLDKKDNQITPVKEQNCKRSIYTQTSVKRKSKHRKSTTAKKLFSPKMNPVLVCKDKIKEFSTETSANTPSLQPHTKHFDETLHSVVYGTLFVFGCNGIVPPHMIGSMASKFVLRKKLRPNAVTESFSYTKYDDEPISISPAKHAISYPLPGNRSVVVAFELDKTADMFQIGRHEVPPIDFKVCDMNETEHSRNGVSRFACRIVVRRDSVHEARIYAAAFDSDKRIFLGDGGLTWAQRGKMDGFTTNGVLIMHPATDRKTPATWREVSVCGYIYPIRSANREATNRNRLPEESNVLQDGTLIDLCGITLLWRTPDGLWRTPHPEYLTRLQKTLHAEVPEYQLLAKYPNSLFQQQKWAKKKAYVYLSCGHVVGLLLAKPPENLKGWLCPVCQVVGPITELTIGVEYGFYTDKEFPAYAFKPCGHAASFKTVKYWSSIKIPNHRFIQHSRCPFCGVKLNCVSEYVKLTLLSE